MIRTGCIRPHCTALMIAGTLLALSTVAPAQGDPSAVADSTFKPQGTFHVELLGSAIIYSFNYDYRFARHGALRAGFEAWGGNGGGVFAVPVTASILFGSGKGCLEIGGGPVFLGGAGDVSSEDFSDEVLISTFAAFRLQPPEGGFLMRAGIGPVFGGGDWIIWPALSFGYSFEPRR